MSSSHLFIERLE